MRFAAGVILGMLLGAMMATTLSAGAASLQWLFSMPHMVATVQDLRRWGVGLRSYSEPMIDTTDASPMGTLLLNILVAVAEFEKGLIAERTRAGMERVRKQGKPVGRRPALNGELDALVPDILGGRLSQRQAAARLGVAVSTISRARLRKGRLEGAAPGRANPDVASTIV